MPFGKTRGTQGQHARCGPLAYWSTLASRHGAFFATSPVENTADEVPLPKSRSSGARRAKAMCAVRAFGLPEYMSLCRTQRTRFHFPKAGPQAQGVQRRCVLKYMSLCRTQRLRFRPPKSGFSSARHREAMCAVRAFGLLEYSRETMNKSPERPRRGRDGRAGCWHPVCR